MLSNEFGFQKERHCIILQKIKLSSHWIINIRKPSSKDKERENKLFAQQAQQQKFQQQAQQKQKQNKKNNKNKNNTNNTRNDNNNKITILNTLNTNTDLNINLGNGAPTDNSHNHLTPNYNIYSASLDTTANDNHINFPSQVIESWFIKNKPKYATVSKILRKLYAFYILSICLLIFVAGMVVYYDEIIYTILQGLLRLLLLLIPLIGIRYLWTKTPTNVNDSFFFRDEMRKLMYVIIVTVGVYALLILLTIVNGIIKKHINKKTFAFIEFTQFENDELIEPLVSSYGSLSRDSLGETTIEVRMNKQDERVGPFMQFLQAISALCGVLAPIFIQISFEISDGYAYALWFFTILYFAHTPKDTSIDPNTATSSPKTISNDNNNNNIVDADSKHKTFPQSPGNYAPIKIASNTTRKPTKSLTPSPNMQACEKGGRLSYGINMKFVCSIQYTVVNIAVSTIINKRMELREYIKSIYNCNIQNLINTGNTSLNEAAAYAKQLKSFDSIEIINACDMNNILGAGFGESIAKV